MANKTVLDPISESIFQNAYSKYAYAMGMNPDPDHPLHFYDFRGQWLKNGLSPNAQGHMSSEFKLPGHPRTSVGGYNTQTFEPTSTEATLRSIFGSSALNPMENIGIQDFLRGVTHQ